MRTDSLVAVRCPLCASRLSDHLKSILGPMFRVNLRWLSALDRHSAVAHASPKTLQVIFAV
jgi:hypothetical protein